MNKTIKYQWRIILILLVILVVALGPRLLRVDVADILDYTPGCLPLAAVIMLGIFCLKAFVMIIPAVALYIASGILFPTGWAFFIVCAGLLAEASIGYILGRRMGGDRVRGLIEKRPRVAKLVGQHRGHDEKLCFFARLLPVPFDVASMFFGASGMPYPRYAFFSLLGAAPVMVPYVLTGMSISTPLSVEFLVPFGISIAVSLTVLVIFHIAGKK